MASLNVAVMVADGETPEAPAAGVEATTRGGVTSGTVIASEGVSAELAETTREIPFADTE